MTLAADQSKGVTMQNFKGLKALFLNCTLKKTGNLSHTEGLMKVAQGIMEKNGVSCEILRPVDFEIAPGVQRDMTEHGWERDDWPHLLEKVMEADILVIGTPIWLGEKSSECTRLIERLYATSSETNEKGQYSYYGKVGGCVITGNEDGVKHCGMNLIFSLQHLGFTIPPQAEAGWIGEAGPGPSYLDEGSGGPENEFTNRTVTFMSWNLMHMARMLREQNGIPAQGNVKTAWEAGQRSGFENPEYR